MRKHSRTRVQGRELVSQVDPDSGETWVTGLTSSGRLIEKNRSDRKFPYGYKSHLTHRQRVIIRWALRQRHRGVGNKQIYAEIMRVGAWKLQPMQYPLRQGTIASWALTYRAERAKGRPWPLPDVEEYIHG